MKEGENNYMVSQKKFEEFKNDVDILTNKEYKVIRKPTDDEIKNDYKLNDKIFIKHSKCNNIYPVKPYKFMKGQRCPFCYKEHIKKSKENKEKEKINNRTNRINNLIEKFNLSNTDGSYELLSQPISYNKSVKIRHHCYDGTINDYEIKHFSDFIRKTNPRRCRRCSHAKPKFTLNDIQESINNLVGDEYRIVGDYINTKTKVDMLHTKCNRVFPVTINNFKFGGFNKGTRCPYCNAEKTISNTEKEIAFFIKEIVKNKIITSDRSILTNNQELDIYIPDLKIAIEFDGLYWHSDIFKNKYYHLNKTNQCEEKGIRLIHIFEDEWLNNQNLVKEKLKYILNSSNNLPRIYARNCIIKKVDDEKKNKFLNKYHIQGTSVSSINLGLYWKNPLTNKYKLISIMTFCKPRNSIGNNNCNYDYELVRFASNNNYIVIGAFSKLFKYFERNYEWNKIVSYADRRWSQGNLYLKNNWKFVSKNKPSYWYVSLSNHYKRYHRSTFKKQNIKKRFPDIYNDNKTEKEMMNELGYYRIYDCGTITYIYERR